MDAFRGESEEWTTCFLRALCALGMAGNAYNAQTVADEAEEVADAALVVLGRRAEARQKEADAKLAEACAKVRAQGTYRMDYSCGDQRHAAEVWTVHNILGRTAYLRRPPRPEEVGRDHFEASANVFALAACATDDPDEDTGFMPWNPDPLAAAVALAISAIQAEHFRTADEAVIALDRLCAPDALLGALARRNWPEAQRALTAWLASSERPKGGAS